MKIRQQDVQRHIIYQNVKRARINDEEEIAYSEFDGYEISTVHVFAHNRGMWFEEPVKEKYQTYRWYGKGGLELLEEYPTLNKAIKGHQKWCQKEYSC